MGYWEPGTQYSYGDVVTYEGHDYKIIQPHRSQSDWTPPVTPALWGRLQDGHHSGGHAPVNPKRLGSPPRNTHNSPPSNPTSLLLSSSNNTNLLPPKYNNDDKHSNNQAQGQGSDDGKSDKKAWLLGGGIAAGAALLGAAGIAVLKHRDHKEYEAEENNWLAVAERRTEEFGRSGPKGPTTWVLNRGKRIPEGAIVVGKEHDWTLYICRAYHKGTISTHPLFSGSIAQPSHREYRSAPGKASDVFEKGAVIGYAHDEIHKGTYEILLGDMSALRWVPASGKLNSGKDEDGSELYVARAHHKGCFHPGKASAKLKGAFIPYDGGEKEISDYEVLCYN
ncbi:carbohydrate-binding module family 12 protein [Ephemerocybe angulata]|uniref:Carbohydrate-binding module family 12 protein n=1 Tax=Ephemerocybe angulata TaxID=980116 RepID=A0A8H6I930_9AGAR|nr:carbohydrate-binding module family 12 protein [Tulosesus angulatus]